MPYKLNTKKPHLFCLILLISFPSAVTVLISPALPVMSTFFHVPGRYTEQLITVFLMGYALGQLFYSPLANRYGRKMAIYLGMLLYLISCLVCLAGIYQHSLGVVFIGRFLMALGSCVGMIISFTLINDFYYPQQARVITSYTVLAYSFMPALAVTLGGFITTHFSWVGCFYFYVVYGIVIFWVSLYLPETLQRKKLDALKIKSLLCSYYNAFRSWRLMLFSLIYGLMAAFVYIIAGAAPFIAITEIGLTPADYGMLMLIPYSGQLIGSLLSGYLSERLSGYQVMLLGYAMTIFGSVALFFFFLFAWVSMVSLIFPLFFVLMGLPMTYSTVTIMALLVHEDKASASAIMSFTTISMTLIAMLVLALLPSKNVMMMPLLFIVLLAVAVVAFWHAKNRFPGDI